MSDNDIDGIFVFWIVFSIIGIAGMVQSHTVGPFSSIVYGILIGAVLDAAFIAFILLIRHWWFWACAALTVLVGFLHELFRW